MNRWPHAPVHAFSETGTYMVTGATLKNALFFKKEEEFDLLQNSLLELAELYHWQLVAWAIFSNHYHFIAKSDEKSASLGKFIKHFHASSAIKLNASHGTSGRKVWYQFWDTKITYQKSYLVRLNYVMQNPVRHKLVPMANQYR